MTDLIAIELKAHLPSKDFEVSTLYGQDRAAAISVSPEVVWPRDVPRLLELSRQALDRSLETARRIPGTGVPPTKRKAAHGARAGHRRDGVRTQRGPSVRARSRQGVQCAWPAMGREAASHDGECQNAYRVPGSIEDSGSPPNASPATLAQARDALMHFKDDRLDRDRLEPAARRVDDLMNMFVSTAPDSARGSRWVTEIQSGIEQVTNPKAADALREARVDITALLRVMGSEGTGTSGGIH